MQAFSIGADILAIAKYILCQGVTIAQCVR